MTLAPRFGPRFQMSRESVAILFFSWKPPHLVLGWPVHFRPLQTDNVSLVKTCSPRCCCHPWVSPDGLPPTGPVVKYFASNSIQVLSFAPGLIVCYCRRTKLYPPAHCWGQTRRTRTQVVTQPDKKGNVWKVFSQLCNFYHLGLDSYRRKCFLHVPKSWTAFIT